jgi:hypothetical protein
MPKRTSQTKIWQGSPLLTQESALKTTITSQVSTSPNPSFLTILDPEMNKFVMSSSENSTFFGPDKDRRGSETWVFGFCHLDIIKSGNEEFKPIMCLGLNLEMMMKKYREFNYRFLQNSQVLLLKSTDQNPVILNYPETWGVKYAKSEVQDFPIRCKTGIGSYDFLQSVVINKAGISEKEREKIPKRVSLCVFDSEKGKVAANDFLIEGRTQTDAVRTFLPM